MEALCDLSGWCDNPIASYTKHHSQRAREMEQKHVGERDLKSDCIDTVRLFLHAKQI